MDVSQLTGLLPLQVHFLFYYILEHSAIHLLIEHKLSGFASLQIFRAYLEFDLELELELEDTVDRGEVIAVLEYIILEYTVDSEESFINSKTFI